MMNKLFLLLVCVFFTQTTFAQTVGKIKSETYQAEFEKENLSMMFQIIGVI